MGLHDLGKRNDREERLAEFCIKHKLVICNTWFEQRENAKHTWSAPDGRTKNQIHYIMINNIGIGYRNIKARPGTDCGSDHNPIVIDIKTKLKRVKKSKSTRKKWNVSNLDQEVIKEKQTHGEGSVCCRKRFCFHGRCKRGQEVQMRDG